MTKVSILLMTAALIAGMAGCDGDGYSQNLEIRTWYDLDDVRDNLAGNHILMNDLDSTAAGYEELASPTANQGKGWEPIGSVPPQHYGLTHFVGTFDGQGYEIHDLFINRPNEEGVGLFAYVEQEGVIKDIGVVNATVTGGEFVGLFAVVGLGGRIEDIGVVNATVTGDYYVGGLAGWNFYGTVSNSYSSGSVTTNDYDAGGLVGCNEGTVSESYSTCSVTGNWRVGGLVGENDRGTVSNCYSTGSVTGNSSVGGLVGINYESGAIVNNSFWDIETSGQASSDGGRGTGKTTAEMRSIVTFSGAGWNITAVALNETNPAYIWNIVNNVTYPFLSWQPV